MNSANQSSCPKCGAAVPAEAPHGLCPKCVLEGAAAFSEVSEDRKGRAESPSVEAVAAAFPDLEVMELIGAGGMGSVYKARQSKLDRMVALKILSLDLAADPAFAERFNREARMLGLLNHANIVAVYDFGQQADFYYLLMEYVDGVNLRQAMQAGSFSPPEALAIVPDICAALQFAHDEGVMHRDIKPENILIDTRGRVKIADFGVAKLMGEKREPLNLTVSGTVVGTPNYMAPEQLENSGDVDHRADIYSLGVVFYEMLTGELPIGRFEAPSERAPMDARVDDVVLRTLEKQREKRFQSAGEIKTDVEAITQTPAAARRSPVDSSSSGRASARWATWSAVLTALSLLFVIPLFIMLTVMTDGTNQPGQSGPAPFMFLFGMPFLPAAMAVAGFFLGLSALREIRNSNGVRGGVARAMFGSLVWPLVFLMGAVGLTVGLVGAEVFGRGLICFVLAGLAMLTVGLVLTIAVWRWATCFEIREQHRFWTGEQTVMAIIAALILLIPTLLVMVPVGTYFWETDLLATPGNGETPANQGVSTWWQGRPVVDVEITVAPGQVATFALAKLDGDFLEGNPTLNGFVIAADDQQWTGRVQIGATGAIREHDRQPWEIRMKGPNGEYGTTGNLFGKWDFEKSALPSKLILNTASERLFELASPIPGGAVTNGSILLLVISHSRIGPNLPEVELRRPVFDTGTTNWVEKLKQQANKEVGGK